VVADTDLAAVVDGATTHEIVARQNAADAEAALMAAAALGPDIAVQAAHMAEAEEDIGTTSTLLTEIESAAVLRDHVLSIAP